MNDFYIVFDNKSNKDLGIDIVSRPSIPSPIERVKVINISDREDVYDHTGVYEDISISVEFNFDTYDDDKEIRDIFRKLKTWLMCYDDNKLIFSDNSKWFYKVNNIIISETALQDIYDFGNCTVEFILNPYEYEFDGLKEIEVNTNTIYNSYFPSSPQYIIRGNGYCTLIVNDNELKVNVTNNCIVDTELGLCIRDDGTFYNVANNINSYKDFYLKKGNNTISIPSGFKLSIIPNWRCI